MKGTIRIIARSVLIVKGTSEICPLRIHGSIADASAERAARSMVGAEKELKANTRLPSLTSMLL
jgi:hypothetical protein